MKRWFCSEKDFCSGIVGHFKSPVASHDAVVVDEFYRGDGVRSIGESRSSLPYVWSLPLSEDHARRVLLSHRRVRRAFQ